MVDEKALTVDALAQEIRRVDGNHSLGAGALAEAILPFIARAVALAAFPAAPAAAGVDVREALKALLDHVDVETCVHEETHRGGFLWTICDQCGRKWADDEGGFVPHADAPAVARARMICEALPGEPKPLPKRPTTRPGGSDA